MLLKFLFNISKLCILNFVKVFGNMEVKYTIHFNSKEAYSKNIKDVKKRKEQESDEGPVVDRRCQKCGNEKMSYATLQLRSADEGQTVFYTCTKCGYVYYTLYIVCICTVKA